MAAEKPITNLLADMPENWTNNQIVSSDGTSVGLTKQHGYNYLMKKVNETAKAVNDINDAFSTLTTDKELQTLGSLVKGMYLLMHPVGSIIFNTTGVNPGTVFGGTWVEWGKGRVPVGVNKEEPEFNTVEKTGGEKTHKLTVNEMPEHNHRQYVTAETNPSFGVRVDYTKDAECSAYDQGIDTGNRGGDQPHNNLQPYITCYMWKRTS